jgi:cytochrome c-type biogenesis protein
MLDQFFFTVNSWMAAGTIVAAAGCLVWGMISVIFSPCHMAAIPLIVTYVAGQDKTLAARHAGCYAACFTAGLFIMVAMVGIACTLLGRMLGETGPYWNLLIGAVLLWVACDTVGMAQCRMPASLHRRIKIQGLSGAFVLGLFYGIVSGSCTFGFIAPILAMITVQDKVVAGPLFILTFTLGYCIPVAIAGSSAATVRRLLESSSFHSGSRRLRCCAGIAIGILGIYFVLLPFI